MMTGQKFMQGRIDQPDDHRQAVHDPEQAGKILALEGQQGIERFAPLDRQVAMIIFWTCGRRSVSKNMCSVRHRPMPSAP
jgi:hypothetical protein